ncbi:uncharacterized protein LOC142985535 [Anticarsia gemmatalis]|uniref:uncharacterized protein LOC142985535 n=1 Tax=Anticarsia gemmatalis TaxID=129554 RepID=UPI003F75D069
MASNYCFLKIYLTVIFVFSLTSARRYDVEAESVRLYGEDFYSVLQRFRRTWDYLAILEARLAELLLTFADKYKYITFEARNKKLKERVDESCGMKDLLEALKTTTVSALRDDMKFKHRRNLREDTTQSTTTTTMSPIEILESYPHYSNELSAKERNTMKDLALDQASQALQLVIKSMGPLDSSSPKSTRQPYGGLGEPEKEKPVDHVMQVYQTKGIVEMVSTANDATSDPLRYKLYYKKPY